MALTAPTILVQIGFASNPMTATGSVTWTDVTAYCLSFSVHFGRQHELGRVEAGRGSVVLDNKDRRFDPTNTSSPYYPNVVPAKRVRIQATYNSITYPIFSGFVETWPLSWPNVTDSYATINLVDAFKFLNYKFLTTQVDSGSVYSGTRVANVLTAIGWPSADQTVEIGESIMQQPPPIPTTDGSAVTPVNALQHLTDVANTEGGLFFQAPDGKLTFYQRAHLVVTSASSSSQKTFGDGGGTELPYVLEGLDPVYDDIDLYNDIQMTRTGGTLQQATDSTSQTKYGQRSFSQTGLQMVDDNDLASRVTQLLSQYKDPYLRIRRLSVTPYSDPTNLFPQALGRLLWDRITVKRRPPGGGSVLSQDEYIESIQHDYTPGDWRTTWALSPATLAGGTYLTLDDSTNGKLDVATLAY